MSDDTNLLRLEAKVDKLTDAVSKLILVEERLANQGERIGRCEKSIAIAETSVGSIEKKLDQWVNRGIGVWAAVLTVFGIVQYITKFL